MLKAEGDGTSEEILNYFLLVYRTTAHPTLEGKSSAQSLFERNPRTIHASMVPRSNEGTSRNHGRKYGFEIGNLVYAQFNSIETWAGCGSTSYWSIRVPSVYSFICVD